MRVLATDLPEVLLIEPSVFADERGFLSIVWHRDDYASHGIPSHFVQDNLSRSRRGTVRGLHLQHPHGQGKLVSVVAGEVFDVAVDVRVGSPNFGCATGHVLSGDNHRQLYIPAGFAHGFCVTSEVALFHYKCTDGYHPEAEIGIAWNDPDIAISWPLSADTLSDRDRAHPRLAAIEPGRLPHYAPSGT